MNDERRHDDRDREQDDARVRLPHFTSLVIMLGVFATIIVLSLFAVLDREPMEHLETAGGRVAYGPADFPEIGFDIPPPDTTAVHGAFLLPPPPFSDDIFPCSDCHDDMEPDATRRELTDMHEDIVLRHGPPERWCFDCHNAADRDSLRLASGELIGFDESYRLCGQCHGTIYRDWREGIHGRRRGYWNGPKTYLLCAHCHDPHQPHFKPLKPLPPRVRPDFLRDQHREADE